MRVILSPGKLPDKMVYRILEDSPDNQFFRLILESVRPDMSFKGFVDTDTLNQSEGYVLVTNLKWLPLISSSPAASQNKTILIPIAVGDSWGYWDMSRQMQRELGTLGKVDIALWRCFLIKIDRAHRDSGLSRLLWFGHQHLALPGISRKQVRLGWRRYLPNLEYLPHEDRDFVLTYGYCGYQDKVAIVAQMDKINRVMSRLSDQASKDNYTRILMGDPPSLWRHYLDRLYDSMQYFEYLHVEKGDVIINGGVFTGTEIPLFLALLDGEGAIHNVDPAGFDHLNEYAREAIGLYPEMVFEHKMVLSDKDGEVSISDAGDGQMITGSDDATVMAKALTLDTFLKTNNIRKVDIVKLDIEGDEEAVVPSMQSVIREFRPKLAISVYHKIEHLWNLPLQLMEICHDYNFYINIYQFERYETILYCIPKERDPHNKQ